MKPAAVGKGALLAASAFVGAVAAGWTAQRVVAARVRARDDADAARVLVEPIYVDHHIDTHDRGKIYVVEAGEGPPILLSHGVTLSTRTWFHQLELLPKDGFRARLRPAFGSPKSVSRPR